MFLVHPATTVGEFGAKNEPVYLRKNLHELHTSDKWLQSG